MSLFSRVSQNCRRLVWRGLVALLFTLPGFTASSSTELPSLGENSAINIERETRLGRSVYEKLLAKGYIETDPLLDRYINDLGFRLLAGLDNRLRDYRFFIIRDDAVNAFALPGGYIGVNRGLIRQARTQHQLASVLAHEIAHVRLRHGIDMMEKGKELNTAAMLSMLAGLLLDALVGGDHQHDKADAAKTGKRIVQEALVTGNVDEAELNRRTRDLGFEMREA